MPERAFKSKRLARALAAETGTVVEVGRDSSAAPLADSKSDSLRGAVPAESCAHVAFAALGAELTCFPAGGARAAPRRAEGFFMCLGQAKELEGLIEDAWAACPKSLYVRMASPLLNPL